MKLDCQAVANLLAEDLEAALAEVQVVEHLKECPACRRMRERLEDLERQLKLLAPGESPRPELVKRTLQAVRAEKEPRRPMSLWLKLSLAGAPLVLLLFCVIFLAGTLRDRLATSALSLAGREMEEAPLPPPVAPLAAAEPKPVEAFHAHQNKIVLGRFEDKEGRKQVVKKKVPKKDEEGRRGLLGPGNIVTQDSLLAAERPRDLQQHYRRTWKIVRGSAGTESLKTKLSGDDEGVDVGSTTGSAADVPVEAAAKVAEEDNEPEDEKERLVESDREESGEGTIGLRQPGYFDDQLVLQLIPQLLDEIGHEARPLEGLEFIPARGYFENTYLPGDPAVAWLRRRLEAVLDEEGPELLAPDRVPRPYRQPFDAPVDRALALYLSADRPDIEGRARLLLQVGLKGAERHGRRAPLHAAVLVDLRETPEENERLALWSLVDELARQRSAGDRFWLLAAGPARPLLLEPAGFDAQGARRALASAVEQQDSAGSLEAALDAAYELLAGQEEEDPLAERVVVLASGANPIVAADVLELIEPEVQRWAIGGIHLSAVGVGPRSDAEASERLALAGQGRRWLASDSERARSVAEAELSAAGRVVARALRLTIRLAEGVQLVEVLGSRPLSEARSQREREVEQAIDRRVARQLGIEADRGEDTEGVQIIIPAFYSGDEHVILLDVVASSPGRLAEVELRCKDLVGMRNAVERAALDIGAGERGPGPLELAVLKNELARRLSDRLLRAAESLDAGQLEQAHHALAEAAAAIEVFRRRNPAHQADAELLSDARFLASCLGLIKSAAADEGLRDLLAQALAYSGRVMLPPGDPAWQAPTD